MVNWTVCYNEDYEFVPDHVPDNQIGLKCVDFGLHDAPDSKGRLSRINLVCMLFSLWPRNLKKQLMCMNAIIDSENKD